MATITSLVLPNGSCGASVATWHVCNDRAIMVVLMVTAMLVIMMMSVMVSVMAMAALIVRACHQS
eukprot:713742-Alexandrium_andersonii.AAC.1